MESSRRKPTLLTFKVLGQRQKWRCNLCTEMLESTSQVDHVVPLWMGGSNEEGNLQILCVRCHAVKTQLESIRRKMKPAAARPPPPPAAVPPPATVYRSTHLVCKSCRTTALEDYGTRRCPKCDDPPADKKKK